jgi:hypothetical protein
MYEPCGCPPPGEGVRDLYQKRLEAGKNSILGIAAKLCSNSIYGKFAQTVGESPYGNWVYASLITSGCRIRIIEATGSHPGGIDALLMVATDGVFFDSPHDRLCLSNRLGDWEETKRYYLTQFKPGVYWDESTRDAIKGGGAVKFKARGMNARAFQDCIRNIDLMFFDWFDGGIPESRTDIYTGDEINILAQAEKGWPSIIFQTGFNMTSIIQAIQRNDWGQAGEVKSHMIASQSSTPYEKRQEPHWNDERQRLETYARELENIQTTYYDKKQGMEDPFSWQYREGHGIYLDETMGEALNHWVTFLRKGNIDA